MNTLIFHPEFNVVVCEYEKSLCVPELFCIFSFDVYCLAFCSIFLYQIICISDTTSLNKMCRLLSLDKKKYLSNKCCACGYIVCKYLYKNKFILVFTSYKSIKRLEIILFYMK